MKIDVRDLAGHPGSSRKLHLGEPLEGLRLGLAAVDSPVGGDLLLEGVEDGVIVTGRLDGAMTLTCARCLKPFDDKFDLKVRELFASHPGDDDYVLESHGEIDPEPMIRDAVLLAMPFSPMHAADCKGLCPRCGADRNDGPCGHEDEPADPRWAGLQQFIDQ